MKKLAVCFLIITVAVASIIFAVKKSNVAVAETDYLRIHVRANSNSESDQTVKYEVKDKIVKYITPFICDCQSKRQAICAVEERLKQIEEVANATLEERGYYYGARAALRKEHFPTRVYGEVTLNEGVYDALIIELGTGKGDNWWCCIYPPLCFTSSTSDVQYKSIVAELINRLKSK